jgi:hypothetical protein
MKRRGLWAAVCLVLLVGVGVLAVGAGYAKDEDAGEKCSEATLHGRYLFAQDGFQIQGNDQVPFAAAGYEDFHGNGEVDGIFSSNLYGQILFSKERSSGTYSVKADCTGTSTYPELGVQTDLFVASDGSMFTFLATKPESDVTRGLNCGGQPSESETEPLSPSGSKPKTAGRRSR